MASMTYEPTPTNTFPPLVGQDLLGHERNLPDDFDGQLNLVLLAFYQNQQSAVDSYGPLSEELLASYQGFAYYEVPVIAPFYRVMKPVIDAGMRSYVQTEVGRSRVITVFTNTNKLTKALSLPTKDQIYALLLNAKGDMLFQAQGAYTPEIGQQIRQAVATHGAGILTERAPVAK